MIKIIDGDLLESGANFICHQVNCQGKMNSGVAKQIREKYPEVYEAYMFTCNKSSYLKQPLLGKINMVCVDKHKYVCNLYAQNNYGYDGKQYTDLNALRICLEAVLAASKSLQRQIGVDVRIALPYKIGCVRGGADWDNDVYPMIDEVFNGTIVELWRL